jgi:hypothetical protein
VERPGTGDVIGTPTRTSGCCGYACTVNLKVARPFQAGCADVIRGDLTEILGRGVDAVGH